MPVTECAQLWDVYTMRKLKYKLLAASAISRDDASGDFDKIRASVEMARRAFDAHEATHAPKADPLPVEPSAPALQPASQQASQPETRNGRRAILMPAISV